MQNNQLPNTALILPDAALLRRVCAIEQRPARRPDAALTAIHEAGHLTAGIYLGFEVLNAIATPAQGGLAGFGQRAELANLPALTGQTPAEFAAEFNPPEGVDYWQLALQAVALQAGPIAEELFCNSAIRPLTAYTNPSTSAHDDAATAACLMHMPSTFKSLSGSLLYVQNFARAVLRACWPELNAIAAHLIKHGEFRASEPQFFRDPLPLAA